MMRYIAPDKTQKRKIKIRRNEHGRAASVRPPSRNPVSELEKLEKSSAIARLHDIESGHKFDFGNIDVINHKNFRNHKVSSIRSTTTYQMESKLSERNKNDGLKQNLIWRQHFPPP
ncbi:unnamed protein product [Trichobilharzia regenti]|nr:unnamed protein product [Trichobilharzia regenti]